MNTPTNPEPTCPECDGTGEKWVSWDLIDATPDTVAALRAGVSERQAVLDAATADQLAGWLTERIEHLAIETVVDDEPEHRVSWTVSWYDGGVAHELNPDERFDTLIDALRAAVVAYRATQTPARCHWDDCPHGENCVHATQTPEEPPGIAQEPRNDPAALSDGLAWSRSNRKEPQP